ncbi:unnamed protein product [Timema podura]|uniref:Uncharacterized protein n=1 Tax=Timema podura TaxID=61482 RepID=A0ABN7P3U6_TIMPD|nr:unnamed protein product [Timema podura]
MMDRPRGGGCDKKMNLEREVQTEGREGWDKSEEAFVRKDGGGFYGVSTPRRVTATPGGSLRSNSAIDLQAAQRAKARAQYAALARQKVGSGASLPRPRKNEVAGGMTVSAITSPERVGRTRSRVAGVSQSQPTSRSGSPSSRLSYATYASRELGRGDSPHGVLHPRRLSSGIPRSTGTSREASREPSPNRFTGIHDRSFGSKLRNRPIHSSTPDRPPQPSRPVMAQKILQQSREAESALADALSIVTARIQFRTSACLTKRFGKQAVQ